MGDWNDTVDACWGYVKVADKKKVNMKAPQPCLNIYIHVIEQVS